MFLRFERVPMARPMIREMFDLEREVGSLFDEVITGARAAKGEYAPAVDVAEYQAETVVVAELPGIRKEDVKISFDRGVLTLSGERKATAVPEGATWHRNEIPAGSFSRSIALGHEVNADAISAEMADGVLKIVVPKAEKSKARAIAVR
jgi:HSP20 family protein